MSRRRYKPSAYRFVPGLVSLEGREVPAGNITASVVGGILVVRGDDDMTSLRIDGTGQYSAVIRPLDGCTLNGSTAGQAFGDIKNGYDVQTGGGRDQVILDNINARHTLNVDTGDDVDVIQIVNGTKSTGNARITTGNGDDLIIMNGTRFDGTLLVDTGTGNDRVSVQRSNFYDNISFQGDDGSADNFGFDTSGFSHLFKMSGFELTANAALPIANDDTATVSQNQSTTISVLSNDMTYYGTLDVSTVHVTTSPSMGTAVANSDGTITYTNSGGSGNDRFGYTVRNSGGALSAESFVTVGITNVNTDTTPPTVSMTSSAASSVNSSFSVAATFSETVTGFTSDDITVTNGTVTAFTATDGANYSFTVTPTAQGTVAVSIAAGVAVDSADNANSAATDLTRVFDTVAPVVTADSLSATSATPTITGTVDDSTATVVVTVNGQTTNATVSGTTWSATLSAALANGTYTISVTATDAAGNVGTATQTDGLVVQVGPTATLSTSSTTPTNATSIPYTVAFSTAVTGFSLSGLSVTNGTASDLVIVDDRTFTFNVTPTDQGSVSVVVNTSAAQDSSDLGNSVSNTVSVVFDSIAPVVTSETVSSSSAMPTITGTVDDSTATVVVTVDGQSTTATVSGTSWTATLGTALANGTYTINVTATDAAGNAGTVTQTDGLVVQAGPTATLSTSSAATTNSTSIPYTVTFSRDVTGFTLDDLTVTNGTVGDLVAVNAATYTFTITPADQGAVSVIVNADAAQDSDTLNSTASNTLSVVFDSIAPVVTSETVTSNSSTPTITGTVDDSAATVVITVDGQSATATVSGSAWTATLGTALDNGTYTINVTATDAAGNVGTAPQSDGLVVQAGPTATLSTSSAATTNSTSIPYTVTFSTAVTGFSLNGLSVTNGTATDLVVVDDSIFTFNVTPTGQGTVSVLVNANVAQGSGSLGNTASNTVSVIFDSIAPVVTSETVKTNSFTPTITGTVDDSTATVVVTVDAQSTTATVSGNTWSATFGIALSEGTYTIDVSATDAAGNVGTASVVYGLVIDTTAPTGTIAATATDAITGTAEDANSVASVGLSISNGTQFWDGTDFISESEVFNTASFDTSSSTWSYPFTVAGTYSVNARLTDTAGNSVTISQTVTL